MYATRTTSTRGQHRPQRLSREERVRASIPYCFVLDETYRVILAGPPDQADPLAAYYDVEAPAELLPEAIDRLVRALTTSWRATTTAISATASVGDLQVTVSPLHGQGGRRMVVFVQRILED